MASQRLGPPADCLVWRIPVDEGRCVAATSEIEPPAQWIAAISAVTRDLISQNDAGVVPGLVWELTLDAAFTMGIGWTHHGASGNWMANSGLSFDESYTAATVFIAKAVQSELQTGRNAILWPVAQGRFLACTSREDTPIWLYEDNGAVAAEVGFLDHLRKM